MSGSVEANENKVYRIKCARSEIIFPISTFPLGMTFTNREVCDCNRKRWRGIECDIKFKNALLFNDIARKNNLIADKLLGKERFWRRKRTELVK